MKLKKFFLGCLLAVAGFTSVYAIIQPNINGLTNTTSITPSSAYIMTQDGTTQRKISAENFANSISGSFPLWDYLPLAWNTELTAMSGNIYLQPNKRIFWGSWDKYWEIFTTSINDLSITSTDDITETRWGLYTTAQQPRLIYADDGAGDERSVILNSGALQYGEDYSGDYNNRSLVDKGYVDWQGFLTGYTETDPIRSVVSWDYIPRVETWYFYQTLPSTYIEDDWAQFVINTLEGIFTSSLWNEFRTSDSSITITAKTGDFKLLDNRPVWFQKGLEYNDDYSWNYTARSLPDVAFVTGQLASYIPRTSVDTGFNNTGSDIIIPSEKTVRSTFSWLTANYIPYWNGTKLANTPFVFMSGAWTMLDTLLTNGLHWTFASFSNSSYLTWYDSNSATLRATKFNSWWAIFTESSAYSRGIAISRNEYWSYILPTNYTAFAIWDKWTVEYAVNSVSGSKFRIDYAGNTFIGGTSFLSGNTTIGSNLSVTGTSLLSWNITSNGSITTTQYILKPASWFTNTGIITMSGDEVSIQINSWGVIREIVSRAW